MHMISTVSRLLKILFYHPVSYFSPCDRGFSSLLASALEKHWEVVLLFQQWVRPVFGWGVDLFLTHLHPLRHTHTHVCPISSPCFCWGQRSTGALPSPASCSRTVTHSSDDMDDCSAWLHMAYIFQMFFLHLHLLHHCVQIVPALCNN